jgi:sarcosine oxidase, subunit gamma
MSALALTLCRQRDRLGLKGPRAAEWLVAQGIVLPTAPNSWTYSQESADDESILVARLGQVEFFLEEQAAGTTLRRIAPSLNQRLQGVYPVLREDCGFHLGGEGADEVLAQVCNVNFAALTLDSHPVIMTLMIGVAVLVVPQGGAARQSGAAELGSAGYAEYRIWCDPTFGLYLGESLGAVVNECGGRYTGVSG